jgi:hypothetical protein
MTNLFELELSFQNTTVARAYINAFLETHIHGHSLFNRFLKNQERPSSVGLDAVLGPQHADPLRVALANFENDSFC